MTMWDLFQVCRADYNLEINHTKRQKVEKHVITSIEVEKVFDTI